nr:hypothetical protein [Tanacetum cinerariifolium]
DLRQTKDGLPWPGNANMVFGLRPMEDGLSWPGNANMVFDLRQTEDGLLWPGNANMVFDLRPMGDGLSWSDNANMSFDLRPTKDGLPWLDNANMAFDLRPTGDGLSWPGSANIAFDLVLGLQRLLHMFYIQRYLRGMHEDNYNGIVHHVLIYNSYPCIESNVIDTFSLILNDEQKMNSNENKIKYFFHITMITKDMFKWKKDNGESDEEKQFEAFSKTIK